MLASANDTPEAKGALRRWTVVPPPTLYHRWLAWRPSHAACDHSHHRRADRRYCPPVVHNVRASAASLLGGGLCTSPRGTEERRTADAADRRRRADRGAVMGRDQHRLHPALRRPVLPVQARRHHVRHRRRPATSQLPRLRLRRLHYRHVLPGIGTTLRDPQIRHTVLAHAVLFTCSASSSSQARSTLSPGCSGQPRRSRGRYVDALAARIAAYIRSVREHGLAPDGIVAAVTRPQW